MLERGDSNQMDFRIRVLGGGVLQEVTEEEVTEEEEEEEISEETAAVADRHHLGTRASIIIKSSTFFPHVALC